MFSKKIAVLALLLMLLPILAACGGDTSTATPVPQPTATTAPVAAATDTTAPVAAPTDTVAATTAASTATVSSSTMVTGTSSTTNTNYAAADCGYGGTIKSIQAVDDNTVKFTL